VSFRPHPTWLAVLLLFAACHPSATVERTTPVADLQVYRSAAVRVAAAPGLEAQVAPLEFALTNYLRQRCSFERILTGPEAQAGQSDLVLDLNVLKAGRGGDGFIKNENMATVDVLLVLSDGINGDLVGSAKIKGKSSQVQVSGDSPEQQALDVVARSVGEMLDKSGCSGPRVARAVETPVDAGPGAAPGGDAGPGPEPGPGQVSAEQRAQAEAANDEGKRLFRAADLAGAMAQFADAEKLVPDPRYTFNICLAHEALEEWNDAVTACNRALGMKPSASLTDKINARIAIIRQRQAAK
jgi:hypothetical protein